MRSAIRWRVLINLAGAFMLTTGAAISQDVAGPILNHTFEDNDGGWKGFGPTASVSVTHETTSVKTGKSALQFTYTLKKAAKPGELDLLALPTPDMVLSKAKSIRFWVKTDHATSLTVVLQEKDGGRYSAVFSTPKDIWQQVEISTTDFLLDNSKDAPKDPDGKLDMNEVESAAIFDLAQLFLQGDEALVKAFGISAGARMLYLDDFVVSPIAIAPGTTLKSGEGLFDTAAHPQAAWIALGDIQLSRSIGKPLEGAALQIKYHQGPGKIAGISKNVSTAALAGAARLSLSVASAKPAKFIVQVEERSGGKYNTMIDVPGTSVRTDISINFADFKASDDSHDDDNKLDLDQVTQIILFDVSGILDSADADNTVWINNVKAAK